jgi:hypothetical protein
MKNIDKLLKFIINDDSKDTIASKIKAYTNNFCDAIDLAGFLKIEEDQNWETETSTFYFSDNSFLNFSCGHID